MALHGYSLLRSLSCARAIHLPRLVNVLSNRNAALGSGQYTMADSSDVAAAYLWISYYPGGVGLLKLLEQHVTLECS